MTANVAIQDGDARTLRTGSRPTSHNVEPVPAEPVSRPTCDTAAAPKSAPDQKRRRKTALPSFSRFHLLRPADTEVKFCVGNDLISPNRHKAFIHAAFESGNFKNYCPDPIPNTYTATAVYLTSQHIGATQSLVSKSGCYTFHTCWLREHNVTTCACCCMSVVFMAN